MKIIDFHENAWSTSTFCKHDHEQQLMWANFQIGIRLEGLGGGPIYNNFLDIRTLAQGHQPLGSGYSGISWDSPEYSWIFRTSWDILGYLGYLRISWAIMGYPGKS